ncbi:MAG: chemotaxis protein CheW [Deltaproteobacteria bacterium]|nr:chemotaxis protein CheW [Deltaproteobacteria bacterium]
MPEDSLLDEELVQEFLSEAQERVEALDQLFLDLEASPNDLAIINSIFRSVHTIKGNSGFFGFANLGGLTHTGETLLNALRESRVQADPLIIDLLLELGDAIRTMVETVGTHHHDGHDSYGDLRARLEAALPSALSPNHGPEAEEPAFADEDTAPTRSEEDELDAVFAGAEQDEEAALDALFAPDEEDEEAALDALFAPDEEDEEAALDALFAAGDHHEERALDALFAAGDHHEERALDALFAAGGQVAAPSARSVPEAPAPPPQVPPASPRPAAPPRSQAPAPPPQVPPASPRPAAPPRSQAPAPPPQASPAAPRPAASPSAQASAPPQAQRPAPPPQPRAPLAPPSQVEEDADDPSAARGRGGPRSSANDTIRVRVQLISDLMNQVGELVLARNQCLQHMGSHDLEGLERALANLDHVTTMLQENMMKTRLQSVSQVFSKFPRIVRDLSRTSQKEVRLVTQGENTEVDKTLIEAITGPLTHIIRNAIDHGLESPARREAAGKLRTGTILIEASHQSQHVVISVSDDGAGIDPERVKAKAIEKGVIDPAEAARLSPRQAINLIFAPGFSTAEQITSISGRGVGMDVVRSEIERVNGVVEIESKVGAGTRIELRIPLTLAIIPALNVRVGGHTFAIPQVNMVEVVQFPKEQEATAVQQLGSAKLLYFRDEWIPIVHMHAFLKTGTDSCDSEYRTIAVVRSGPQQVGLVVDTVVDSQEIVVKPLLSAIQRIGCYAGTAILGDGRVVLILDIAGLMRLSRIETSQSAAEEVLVRATDAQQLLLCEHGGQRVVFPLALVARIEEVGLDEITHVGGREAVIFGQRILNLVRLDKHLPIPPVADPERVHVLVFEFGGHEVGIVVDRVLESIHHDAPITQDPAHGPGILGALILHKRGTLLLDVFHLIEADMPSWFTMVNESRPSVKQGSVRVLLAEDSEFFRKLETSYLESAGYEITAGPDGAAALELFKRGRFDIVVTDIEMPNMDGFELTRQIRQLEGGATIPILALTSLTSDSAKQAALAAGVNGYLVKLNREEILHAVAHQLGRE